MLEAHLTYEIFNHTFGSNIGTTGAHSACRK